MRLSKVVLNAECTSHIPAAAGPGIEGAESLSLSLWHALDVMKTLSFHAWKENSERNLSTNGTMTALEFSKGYPGKDKLHYQPRYFCILLFISFWYARNCCWCCSAAYNAWPYAIGRITSYGSSVELSSDRGVVGATGCRYLSTDSATCEVCGEGEESCSRRVSVAISSRTL
ncbi:hypothetical protein PsorP6_012122 [Peronosclerospora sorghi]|uniref:Uncharacterized protein n=1 Tax=Peronosclerospora sorghi TaxID=230839 RepID=A0ACC0WJZ6_9STRA|nr:hypothetical protein PsorP6_012122 [Peronosclerospora sorghi]